MLFHGFTALLINLVLNLLSLVVLIYAILSWIPNVDRRNSVVQLINKVGNTVCEPVRKILPPKSTANIDLSPLIVIVLINFLHMIL